MQLNLQHFFARESCGWCTPCWGGLQWVEQILRAMERDAAQPSDIEILEHAHASACAPGNTFCALAPGAMEPLQSALVHFRDDFEQHIREQAMPVEVSMAKIIIDEREYEVRDGQNMLQAAPVRSASTYRTSAGTLRWAPSAPAASAPSASSATRTTPAAGSSWPA